ncbi:MAG: tRNA (guanosine(46)-N7)-methyltransferase TrmB [Pseudomonadota bacterium]|nr:tRNA (guanosine(46)-N7)-methyltransferase TrmB [Pseudomonadota bacterium]MEC9382371.1 tRNA (guanosine(46)-N7)-methyltransferase TrmB [Pseudomonadota bacterium]MEC9414577.1 tRNA (guanosine(46)-N7)-methyltransferase TrmB [Pseudomonadota bacterium]MEC9481475.1 tRNA (guanosine(46)-N7)-methyltransferase TrmB [Pseudomonadota bacterium]
MNYSKSIDFKKFFTSRNRPLTTKQKLIFKKNYHKLCIESFCNIKKIKDYDKKILEIGFGTGEILFKNALYNPDKLYIGIEYYKKGIAQLLLKIEKYKIKNLQLYYGDALDFIEKANDSLFDDILLMFPDPWPKKKHWKRRFLNNKSVREISRCLKVKGSIFFYTDDRNLAFWGLRYLINSKNLIWDVEKPIDCRSNNFLYSNSKYEIKAIKDKKNPYYFKFIKFEN